MQLTGLFRKRRLKNGEIKDALKPITVFFFRAKSVWQILRHLYTFCFHRPYSVLLFSII